MEVRTFDPRLSAAAAADRPERLTPRTFVLSKLAGLLGREADSGTVYPLYYPDYIAYTTVELDRLLRSDRRVRFLAGVDAITGRVGEVDVELPGREAREVDDDAVIPVSVDEEAARSEWRDWIFEYVNRRFRPTRLPDFSLDELELVYVPYWLIDHGTVSESFVVSGLTKQVERVEDLKPVREYYGTRFE